MHGNEFEESWLHRLSLVFWLSSRSARMNSSVNAFDVDVVDSDYWRMSSVNSRSRSLSSLASA